MPPSVGAGVAAADAAARAAALLRGRGRLGGARRRCGPRALAASGGRARRRRAARRRRRRDVVDRRRVVERRLGAAARVGRPVVARRSAASRRCRRRRRVGLGLGGIATVAQESTGAGGSDCGGCRRPGAASRSMRRPSGAAAGCGRRGADACAAAPPMPAPMRCVACAGCARRRSVRAPRLRPRPRLGAVARGSDGAGLAARGRPLDSRDELHA